MGITGPVTAFGERLGERAADGLCGWFQKLWNAKGLARRERFEKFVRPAFEQFAMVHQEYQSAFRAYRQELTDGGTPIRELADRIGSDLRFTAQQRVDLLAVLRHGKGEAEEPFARAIVAYLVTPEESALGDPEGALRGPPPEIAAQVWRRGLLSDLASVLHSNWAMVLDPQCSAPPLYGEEQEAALARLRAEHGIADTDPTWEVKLRRRLAAAKLDCRVEEMLGAYRGVRDAYEALRPAF